MDSIRDQHLDPPEAPTHEICFDCHDVFDRDDMTEVEPDTWVCRACLSAWTEANKEVDDE